MTALAVEQPTLEARAETINREHRLAAQSAAAMFEHQFRAGEELLAAKKDVPHGQWQNWLAENVECCYVTAKNYMRAARKKDEIRATGARSLNTALRMIAYDPRAENDPDLEANARQLYAQDGYTLAMVAEELGMSVGAIHRRVRPEKYQHQLAQQRARTVKARRALLRQERDAVVKAAGGSVADAYGYVRRALQALERADRDSTPEVRREISAAMGRLYRAEDFIVKASKLS